MPVFSIILGVSLSSPSKSVSSLAVPTGSVAAVGATGALIWNFASYVVNFTLPASDVGTISVGFVFDPLALLPTCNVYVEFAVISSLGM